MKKFLDIKKLNLMTTAGFLSVITTLTLLWNADKWAFMPFPQSLNTIWLPQLPLFVILILSCYIGLKKIHRPIIFPLLIALILLINGTLNLLTIPLALEGKILIFLRANILGLEEVLISIILLLNKT